MRLSRTGPLLATLLLGAAVPALAQGNSPVGEVHYQEYTLDNGLQVILSPDHSVPVTAVDVWYHVGSANERPTRTGFAHLFEHMMFQGSANVPKGEHMKLVQRAGGSMNGSTTNDRTNYFETLPANRVNLGLWLEADRMRSLAVNQTNLDNQREVVKEEKRMRVDNQPYAKAVTQGMSTIPYDSASCYAYAHTTIGSMADLNAAKLQDVKHFFATYYAPNNATLTVTGDFDPAQVKELIQQYFGSIPSGEEVPPVECTDAFSKLPTKVVVEDPNANLPAVFYSYGMPAAGNDDTYPLQLLAAILAGGESSRLNERLVRQEKAALQSFSFPDFRRGPSIFLIGAIASQGTDVERLQTLLDEEIAKVRQNGVTAAELEKAKNQARAQTVRGLQTAFGKAEALQEANLFYGDPGAIRTNMEKTMAVTLDDIKRVANEYLTPQNRAIIIDQPPAAAGKE